MSTERSESLVALLSENRSRFESVIGGIGEHEAALSRPGGWTILGIVEHLCLVERGMLRLLRAARPAEDSLCDPGREEEIDRRVKNRAIPVEAPGPVQPSGQFGTVAAALEALTAARLETLAYVSGSGTDFDCVTAKHPKFGLVSGHEFLLILAGHVDRHLAQIAEIRY